MGSRYSVATLLLLASVVVVSVVAEARWRPEYAQLDEATRRWFNEQMVPGTSSRCCSTADGEFAEEEIRDGHYWARFTANVQHWSSNSTQYETEKVESGWIEVPEHAVIAEPNRRGVPVVWWIMRGADQDGKPRLSIRCYAPGAKG